MPLTLIWDRHEPQTGGAGITLRSGSCEALTKAARSSIRDDVRPDTLIDGTDFQLVFAAAG